MCVRPRAWFSCLQPWARAPDLTASNAPGTLDGRLRARRKTKGGGKLLWKFLNPSNAEDHSGYSELNSPAVTPDGADVLMTSRGGRGGYLFSVSISSGKLNWKASHDTGYHETGTRAGPVVTADGAHVLLACRRYTLCYTTSGKKVWDFEFYGNSLSPAPTADSASVFVADDRSGELFREEVDKPYRTLWKYRSGRPDDPAFMSTRMTVSSNDEFVVIADSKRRLHCVEVSSGKRRWILNATQTPGLPSDYISHGHSGQWSAQVVTPDNTLVLTGGAQLYCIWASSGQIKWRRSLTDATQKPCCLGWSGSPVVTPDGALVLVHAHDEFLYCLSVSTGKLKWKFELLPREARGTVGGNHKDSRPVVTADGAFVIVGTGWVDYYATERGCWHLSTTCKVTKYDSKNYVWCIDISTGKLEWRHRVGPETTTPVLTPDNTIVLVGVQGGRAKREDDPPGYGGPPYEGPAYLLAITTGHTLCNGAGTFSSKNRRCACGLGHSSSAARCTPCGAGAYQDSQAGLAACKPQPRCGPGQRLSGTSSIKPETCVACPPLTYQHNTSHQFATCTPQPTTCGPGQSLGTSSTKIESCVGCPELTYQPATNHQLTVCKTQSKTCGPNQRLVA